jgi:CBS domain-containing protein
VHRLVVVEGEVLYDIHDIVHVDLTASFQEEEKRGGKKGRLLGIITLSDVLRYVIGQVDIGEGVELL